MAARWTWPDLMQLNVVSGVSRALARRWNLGLGFAAADGTVARAPRPGLGSLCPLIQSQPPGYDACVETARCWIDLARGATALGQPLGETTCHAGLRELAVPVHTDGELFGCLVVGGWLGEGDAAREKTPRLGAADLARVRDLLDLAAGEIAAVCSDSIARDAVAQAPLPTRYSYDAIIGRSAPMQELYRVLDKVIESDSTVLVQGENGTGKELIAKAIHFNSVRKHRRFLVQNCSAFNDNLLDSELFGHRRGAFTGAFADKQGLFDVADGGTFFLDEIGDMSPSLQVKLLRVIQEGTFTPVGDTNLRKVDVRIIAATNRDLKTMVERGEFREDLYYRVNVINLLLPSLRERRDDIPVLIEHFLKKHSRARRTSKRLAKGCLEQLVVYAWPGNVRELENELERLVVLAGDEKVIAEELLSPRIRQAALAHAADEDHSGLPGALVRLERNLIGEALRRHRGNKTRAAAELRVSRRNLIRLVQKYELES